MKSTAYTYRFPGIVSQIIINCKVSTVSADDSDSPELKALWDTGAVPTCISESLARKMGLKPVDSQEAIGANNEPFDAKVYCIKLRMGNFVIPFIQVLGLPMDGSGHDLIIGMDVISRGDMCLTNFNGHTVLTFRTPSMEKVDYVEEMTMNNKCIKMHQLNMQQHRPDKCACGSGRDFNNCHGKSVYSKITK